MMIVLACVRIIYISRMANEFDAIPLFKITIKKGCLCFKGHINSNQLFNKVKTLATLALNWNYVLRFQSLKIGTLNLINGGKCMHCYGSNNVAVDEKEGAKCRDQGDEDGKEINPRVPQYMPSAHWYLNADRPVSYTIQTYYILFLPFPPLFHSN